MTDDKGNEIHYINSQGVETWNKYDSNGNQIYYKTSKGSESWSEYDSYGNTIYYKTIFDSVCMENWIEYTYYPDGKIKTKAAFVLEGLQQPKTKLKSVLQKLQQKN